MARVPNMPNFIQIVGPKGTPNIQLQQWWNEAVKAIEESFVEIETVLGIAEAAETAAENAQTAADAAQTAADSAQTSAESATGVTLVVGSGVDANPLSASDAGSDATITVANHSRIYSNGTTVAVTGASITGLAYSTKYYIYYDDPDRLGGAVSYQTTTSATTAAQTGDRHLVGSITTPAAAGGSVNGEYIPPPGIDRLTP